MRQLLTILAILLASEASHAFEDSITIKTTESLIINLQNESNLSQRLLQLEQYKDFLYSRLNNISIPDINTTSDNDPVLEEYRSLTEFDGYINLIQMNEINASNCQKIKARIENNTSRTREGAVVPESAAALNLLAALCK